LYHSLHLRPAKMVKVLGLVIIFLRFFDLTDVQS